MLHAVGNLLHSFLFSFSIMKAAYLRLGFAETSEVFLREVFFYVHYYVSCKKKKNNNNNLAKMCMFFQVKVYHLLNNASSHVL